MPDAHANLIFSVVLAAWIVGAITVWIRYRQAQRDYLSHFPPVNGYPLQEYFGRNPRDPVDRAINALVR